MKFHIPFKNDDDRITLARQVIVDSVLNSLENDVNECLRYSYNRKTAPTNAYSPALLYCFSAIDLMGSLYAGRAKGGDTSRKAENYMIDFMKYSGDNVKKLQMIYRHKLVHLAIPKTVFYYNGRYITWKLHDPDQAHHLNKKWKDPYRYTYERYI
jgi:hypothetical protein